jgi:cytoskeletal protein CcmA (bactofilin family)
MAMWKESVQPRPTPAPSPEVKEPARFDAPPPPPRAELAPVNTSAPAARPDVRPAGKESLIASDITIEGKIEGGGSVRIAGKFKGDVSVQGDLTVEAGAKLTGSVRANKVTIAGELEGNVEEAVHVDLLASGVVVGDLKTGTLTVAAGARMRGHADFGWGEGKSSIFAKRGNGHDAETRTVA